MILITLQLLPEEIHRALWYDRSAISEGQLWRIITGNLVHLGWTHLALNVGALLIGIWIFYPARNPIAWTIAQVTCSISTSLGLFFFSPEIPWCVGMSGALHGLLMIGAIDWIRQGDRAGWILLLLWTGKLAWEQWQGPLPLSSDALGSDIVIDAHLWGAVGGVLYAAAEALHRGRRQQRLK